MGTIGITATATLHGLTEATRDTVGSHSLSLIVQARAVLRKVAELPAPVHGNIRVTLTARKKLNRCWYKHWSVFIGTRFE